MSFRCEKCGRAVVDNINKLSESDYGVVQLSARPVRIVVERHQNGQIKSEKDMCNRCAREVQS